MLLFDIMTLRRSAYRHALKNTRSALFMFLFVLSTGALYGTLVSFFQQRLNIQIHGLQTAEISPHILYTGNILSGVLMTMFFHGGITLLVWFSARGMGGQGRLADLYRCTAYLLPVTCLGLPHLTLRSLLGSEGIPETFAFGTAAYPFMGYVSAVLLIAGLYRVLRVSQCFDAKRSIGSVTIFFLFSLTVLLYLN